MPEKNSEPTNRSHTLSVDEVVDKLDLNPGTGLSAADVSQRMVKWGPNKLPEVPPRTARSVFIAQFKSILFGILFSAALLAAAIGNTKDAIVILCVILINATVGFYQEFRAEKSLAALKKMLPAKTTVRRESAKVDIHAEALVPGDIVLLEAGDKVPADGRLMVAAGLEVDESALTGESQPVAKDSDIVIDAEAALGDRINMAYMNTMLTRGRAELIVTNTGASTEMGLLSAELASAEESPTPLQIQLDKLGRVLGIIALSLVGLLSFFEWLRGTEITHILLSAIALAVAAIPEGLPVVVTVTLALGMRNMARQKAIVKRLASVETLGCTTVICSDKTGTLTLNQMTVRAFYYLGQRFKVSGEGYQCKGVIQAEKTSEQVVDYKPFVTPMVACNDSHISDHSYVGDPMEAALLVLGEKAGVTQAYIQKELGRIAEIPFDSVHKYMATFHEQGDNVVIYIKGAPDVLLEHCCTWQSAQGDEALDDAEKTLIHEEYITLANDGLRGLMVARRVIPKETFNPEGDLFELIKELTFVGLVGLMDPPRAEAGDAIAECRKAGIAVKMITGDHKSTGAAIAKELGLQGNALTGAELDKLNEKQLAEVIDDTVVFARVSPEHKVKIVKALQEKEHVVAMTGDGVNDAPALKSADIGVAMGINGTEVSKEAATMILVDDNFATIVKAVHRGRTLYDNILKFVRFQLSTTIGAILTVFFAPLVGLPEPFTPVQILWVAIIMDGPPAISLALDSGRPGIMMDRPRAKGESILPISRLSKIIAYGIVMMVGTLLVLHYGMISGSESRALTMAFTTFVLFQVFNVFNARNEHRSAFNRNLFDNKMLWLSLGVVMGLQIVAVHWPPAAEVFRTTGMEAADWGISIAVAASILFMEETRKWFKRLLH